LDAARAEIKYAQETGHDIVIVNDDVEVSKKQLEKVAMGYEGWETCGDKLPALDISQLD
jgi:guanylate kinase